MARSRRGTRSFDPDARRPAGPSLVAGQPDGASARAPGPAQQPVSPSRPPLTRSRGDADAARASGQRWVPALALLPLRIFAGFTFLFAGVDKLALDHSFLDLAAATSILAQLHGYAHASPLAPLITAVAIPNAWLMGVTIALAEIAVGLGVLTGLAFRLSAAGGAALSFLFFLTASWNVHPYYFGQDLPYMMGFVTLAAAGHGDLYVLGPWLERRLGVATMTPPRRGRAAPVPAPMSPERRLLLHAAVVGAAAIAIATVVRPLRDLLAGDDGSTTGALVGRLAASASAPGPGAPAGTAGGSGAATSPATGASAGGGSSALAIATTAQVAQAGAYGFQIPVQIGNASPGDPGIVVSLGSGKFAAFDAICTHAGCTVGYDPSAGYLICPCHGATYDPRHNAQPVAGPTNTPLTELPIAISNGEITLRA